MTVMQRTIGLTLAMFVWSGSALAADPSDVEKFVKARIEIGEMMTNYFAGGSNNGAGQRPSPEQMQDMRADINTKLGKVLAKYDLTVEEYRTRSKDVFADEAGVKSFLDAHPDLKQRYDALPLDRMGRGGGSGRGY